MHPHIFQVFGHPIYSYGVMLGLSFISGWYLCLYLTNREGIPYKAVSNALMVAIISALVGARVFHLITNPDTWGALRDKNFFQALFASKCEGLVAYGGYIGGVLGAYIYSRLRQIDFWSLLDCAIPSMVLGLGLTRIGCFLAGCCHGQPSDLSWAVVFPIGSPASHVFPDGGPAGQVVSLAVQPTQLYESLLGFFLVPWALLAVFKRRFTGQAFLIIAPLYAIGRYLLEIIRGDTDRGTMFGLSTSQFIGVALLLFCTGVYLYRSKTAPAVPVPLSKEAVEASLIEQGVVKPKSRGKPGKTKPKPGKK